MLNSISSQNSSPIRTLTANENLVSRRGSRPFQSITFGQGVASLILFLVLLRLGIVLFSVLLPMSSLQSVGSGDHLVAGLITVYLTMIGSFLAIGVLTIFLHEIIHGLAALACGYWPRLERGKFEYDSAAHNGQLTPNQVIGISLAPLFILSLVLMPLLLVPALQFFALIALAGNVAGSLDDVWLACRIWSE